MRRCEWSSSKMVDSSLLLVIIIYLGFNIENKRVFCDVNLLGKLLLGKSLFIIKGKGKDEWNMTKGI